MSFKTQQCEHVFIPVGMEVWCAGEPPSNLPEPLQAGHL